MHRARLLLFGGLFIATLGCGGSGGVGAVGCSAGGPAPRHGRADRRSIRRPRRRSPLRSTFEGPVAGAGDDPDRRRSEMRGRERRQDRARVRIDRGRQRPGAAERLRLRQGRPRQIRVPDSGRARRARSAEVPLRAPRRWACASASALSIRNSDPLLHNVRVEGQINRPFNMSTPLQGVSFDRDLRDPRGDGAGALRRAQLDERIRRRAWTIRSSASPTPTARVALTGLPPGTYTIEAWHETLGTKTEQITVGREGIEGCQLHLHTLTPAPPAARRPRRPRRRARPTYVTLTKPRLNFLVLLTTAAAYSLGSRPDAGARRSRCTRCSAPSWSPAARRRSTRCGNETPIALMRRTRRAAAGRHAADANRRHGCSASPSRDRHRRARAIFINLLSAAVALFTAAELPAVLHAAEDCGRRCRRSSARCRARCRP